MRFIPTGVSRPAAAVALKLQTKSPKLLLVGGIAGTVTAAVLASRATLQLPDLLNKVQDDLDLVDQGAESIPEKYTAEKVVKIKATIRIKAATDIAKLYGPAVLIGAGSIALLVGSHNILSKQNASLTAAYAALDKTYRAYRARVVAELGEEKDLDFQYDRKVVQVTEVDEKTGKKTTKNVKKAHAVSEYGVLFTRENPNWAPNIDTNIYTLRCIEQWANDRLRARGYLSLNELYRELRVDETDDGQVVGWALDGNGDGYISLGIFDNDDPSILHDYILGFEKEIWIDPNVDGLFYNKISKINQAKKS